MHKGRVRKGKRVGLIIQKVVTLTTSPPLGVMNLPLSGVSVLYIGSLHVVLKSLIRFKLHAQDCGLWWEGSNPFLRSLVKPPEEVTINIRLLIDPTINSKSPPQTSPKSSPAVWLSSLADSPSLITITFSNLLRPSQVLMARRGPDPLFTGKIGTCKWVFSRLSNGYSLTFQIHNHLGLYLVYLLC